MFDYLTKQLGQFFGQIKDHRRSNASYMLADVLKGAFAMFSLKSPSLLMFRQNFQCEVRKHNLRTVYGVEQIPEDTALRETIDGVNPTQLHPAFPVLIDELRSEGLWESRQVLDGYTSISIDGTGYFCSGKKSCPHCLVKTLRNGEKRYYHQMLGAVQMHPDVKTVFPVGGEAIVRQDGATKNDCEQNAAKRLIPRICKELKQDKLLFVLDGLYATGPMVKLIKEHQASFVIAIKEGYVLVQAQRLAEQNKLEQHSWSNGKTKSTVRFVNGLILNGQHQEQWVNYVEYQQVDIKTGKTVYANSWITDIPITKANVKEVVAVGRSRWKIENETFNTLKNQGYHLEHNYGHGKKYLATNFALLMLLAFLVDQISQALDFVFRKAWQKSGSKKNLWQKVRQVFDLMPALSMNAIYKFIAKGPSLDFPLLE
jgi:hypothetical protein